MRRTLTSIIVLAAILLLAAPAFAGGWATVRLDEPPGGIPTGQPWRFGFMVLQHDVTPNSNVTPVVHAVHLETGEAVTATAEQEGPTGHFVVELTLPTAGEWRWAIAPEPYAETTFPALAVGEPPSDAETMPTGPAATVTIADDWLFQPASLDITPGTTVIWTNRSSIVHAVTLDDPRHTASGLIEPGHTFSVTFDTPGVFPYHCSPHPGMAGTIRVASR